MNKILIIDLMNNVWRANITFGKQVHGVCGGGFDKACNHYLMGIKTHCTCGQEWLVNECRCISQAPEEYVLIYNFFRNLRPLIELFAPDKVYVCDEGHPIHRHELYSEYKANRIVKTAEKQEQKNKLFDAKNEIVRLLLLMPITYVKADNYEADDCVGTLCEELKYQDITVISGDTDFIQLLQKGYEHCRIYSPIKKQFMENPNYVYTVFKSLNGDTSDNIPKLLSPKKAINHASDPELLKKFLSIEENRANFMINRKLIEFVNVPQNELNMIKGSNNFDELKEEFENMSFKSITNDKSWEKYVNTFKCIKDI